ncbi:hypothetical protein BD410DRAFT_492311 [Rickenella mellea]|uniref:K Homology domain-containing protein n=1 Tax=Rickenella mellea TaxID=50990 RepID=A0A4Y7PTF3_9AGAM|nr:hypothetical protein BD410DRAFT_492311 [Rickenella mellea]
MLLGQIVNPTAQSEAEGIAAKRQQNAVAARTSRKRNFKSHRHLETAQSLEAPSSVRTYKESGNPRGTMGRPPSAMQQNGAFADGQSSGRLHGAFMGAGGFSAGHFNETSRTEELRGQFDTSGQATATNVGYTGDETAFPVKHGHGRSKARKNQKAGNSDASKASEPPKKKRGPPPKREGRRICLPFLPTKISLESSRQYPQESSGPSVGIGSPSYISSTSPRYSPTPPSRSYSPPLTYRAAAVRLRPSLVMQGSDQEDNDDPTSRQPVDIPANGDTYGLDVFLCYQDDEESTDEPNFSQEPEPSDSVIFVEIPKVHFHGVVGENSCNITKLEELHGVSITHANTLEAGRYIRMKVQGSAVNTRRAKEEILKIIEFQEIFGSF